MLSSNTVMMVRIPKFRGGADGPFKTISQASIYLLLNF